MTFLYGAGGSLTVEHTVEALELGIEVLEVSRIPQWPLQQLLAGVIYDFGDTAGTTPMMKMHTFVPSGIHAGRLRCHGDSPIVSALVAEGLDIKARTYAQNQPSRRG